MKRALSILLAVFMTLVAACTSNENQNQNKNAANNNGTTTGNKNQGALTFAGTCKTVQIFVHDSKATPGGYDIEDPGDVTLLLSYKQKVNWCVVYDGSDQSMRPDEIRINGFRTPPPPAVSVAQSPLDDGTTDDDYHIPAAQFNDNCIPVCHLPKTGVVYGPYKYTITAWRGGVVKGQQDPRVIINS